MPFWRFWFSREFKDSIGDATLFAQVNGQCQRETSLDGREFKASIGDTTLCTQVNGQCQRGTSLDGRESDTLNRIRILWVQSTGGAGWEEVFLSLWVNSCADLFLHDPWYGTHPDHICAHVNDSICYRRTSITAGGMVTQKHCIHALGWELIKVR